MCNVSVVSISVVSAHESFHVSLLLSLVSNRNSKKRSLRKFHGVEYGLIESNQRR